MTHTSALGPSFRVSICVWRVTVGGRERIRGEGKEEAKGDGEQGSR